jgi:SAM-dependent methyltransferase
MNTSRSARPEVSKLTALNREKPSFPARWLLLNRHLRGEVLDFGCGYGKDVEYFKENDLKAIGYDPHFFPDLPKLGKTFDRITCSFVFNVLEVESRNLAMMQISRLLKPKGRAFISVRRDIDESGFRVVPGTKEIVYQANVFLPFKSVLQDLDYEIYEYRPYVSLNEHDVDRSMISPPVGYEMLAESINAVAVIPKQLRFKQHFIILPKRKAPSFHQLPMHEQNECLQLADYVIKEILNVDALSFSFSIQAGSADMGKPLSMHVFSSDVAPLRSV